MGLLDSIKSLVTEYGTSEVLRERLLLIQGQMEVETEKMKLEAARLQAEIDRLESANERLKLEVGTLRKQAVSSEFVERRGVLFHRLSNGKFEPDAYCRVCKCPMVSFHGLFPFSFSKCGFEANFTGGDLPRILNELSAEFGEA